MFLPRALPSFERQDTLTALPLSTIISVVHSNLLPGIVTPTIFAADERFRPAHFSPPSPLGFTSTVPANFTPVDSTTATSSTLYVTSGSRNDSQTFINPTLTTQSATNLFPIINSTVTTQSQLQSQSPTTNSGIVSTNLPDPSPHPTHNFTPLWIGLGVLAAALALILISIALLRHKRTRLLRQSIVEEDIAATASMEPSFIPVFLGGLKLKQSREAKPVVTVDTQAATNKEVLQDPMSAAVRRTPNGRLGEDGRRFGVVIDIPATQKLEGFDESAEATEEEMKQDEDLEDGTARRIKRRETFDAWKRGSVPPLKREDAVLGSGISTESRRSGSGNVTPVRVSSVNHQNEKSLGGWI